MYIFLNLFICWLVNKFKQHTLECLFYQNRSQLFSTAMSHASWLKNGIGSSCVLKLCISCFIVQSDALALNKMGPENTRKNKINTKKIVLCNEINSTPALIQSILLQTHIHS